MANGRQASVKRLKMAERAQQQMALHFPNMPPEWTWHRKTNDGFTTIPRTMPIVMQIVDAQSKGSPAGHTLFSLWARSPDTPFLMIENPSTFAAEAGFTGERAVDTWRKRMKILRELWLIATKPGPSGEFHYVLLINPNASVEWLRRQGRVQDGVYSRFIDRIAEVGAYGEIEAFWQSMVAVDEAAKAAKSAPAGQREKGAEPAAANNEKSPPEAGSSLGSSDGEGGVTPRPHAPFDELFKAFQEPLSTQASAEAKKE